MNAIVFWGIAAGCFVLQFVLCFFCKRLWLKLLPAVALLLLAGGCFAFYAASDFLNWAWLILMVCPVQAVGAVWVAWMVYGMYRLAKKCIRV